MSKKGGMRWQKRWFVLSQEGSRPAELAYFREQNDTAPARAKLDLTSDTKIDLLPGRMHGLQVIMQGRALKVHCDSDEDRDVRGYLRASGGRTKSARLPRARLLTPSPPRAVVS
jgi:hypothetical protein